MKRRQAAIVFIFVTVTLDMLALGLIAPVLPKLVLDFLGGDATSAAKWFGMFGTVFAVMQFFFSPVLGVLSDRFGRRPIILLSNLGLGLDYIVMALAPTIGWLFLGRIISGITAASISTGMAYISDVVPKEKRAGAFGMIGVAFGLGFVLGPAIGGLLGDFDPRLPFWVAAGFSLINWLYGFLFVPESLSLEKRKKFTLRRANPVGSLVLLAFASGTVPARHHSIHRLRRARSFHDLGALRHVSLRLERRDGWLVPRGGRCLFGHNLSRARATDRRVNRLGERRTLYIGQFFGAVGMTIAGLARGTGLYFRFHPGHDDVDDFRPGRARNDDAAGERTRTRRTARRDQ